MLVVSWGGGEGTGQEGEDLDGSGQSEVLRGSYQSWVAGGSGKSGGRGGGGGGGGILQSGIQF
jgi:hypothetical protein